jgi:hypothetical protein
MELEKQPTIASVVGILWVISDWHFQNWRWENKFQP